MQVVVVEVLEVIAPLGIMRPPVAVAQQKQPLQGLPAMFIQLL
jgi:hypothetical protein